MAEIDELIEEGLNLYGLGDLDGALLAWERALIVDPENAQANSYVDYVRENYHLLTGEAGNHEQEAPFGIDDEPYQIEILPAEAAHLNPTEHQPRTRTADMDAGWFIDEEKSQPRRILELQADGGGNGGNRGNRGNGQLRGSDARVSEGCPAAGE
jgi:hypothetical protein